MAEFQAIVLHEDDTVATAIEDLPAGSSVRAVLPDGSFMTSTVGHPIPFGHKFAIRTVSQGEPAIKYGERIGLMNASVQIGEHVHVHNLESERGRGDLQAMATASNDNKGVGK